ncbi:MAG TPA: ABC transporter ATP-binding protein [Acidimicrobiia bacterium]|nr:ABC transporter ATP-binding protein [Acidimicrobiia bacterium]
MFNQQQPVVQLRGVSKSYESEESPVEALEDVTLDVREHEFLAVVGASGCGKTTLLNLIARVVSPTRGSIERSSAIDQPGGIGMVFQSPTLLPWRTVMSNVLLPAEILRMDKAHARTRAGDLLDLVGLRGFERALPHQLSGGMRQRVGLCRALLSDPPLLLMDEPFGALDAISREAMTIEMQRIWMEERKTAVLVTHSITEAIFLADRIVALSPRPGTVTSIIDNEIPRPRTVHTFELPEFSEYSVKVREMIGSGWGPE